MTEEYVELVESRPHEWADRYRTLHYELRRLLGDDVTIDHIGSTAVPDLPAKDVIDVAIGASASEQDAIVDRLVDAGFELDGQRPGHAWLTFRTGRHRSCVIHILEAGGQDWSRRIEFRDLLRRNPRARAEYLAAKRAAAATAPTWGDYTAAKAPTVTRLLNNR